MTDNIVELEHACCPYAASVARSVDNVLKINEELAKEIETLKSQTVASSPALTCEQQYVLDIVGTAVNIWRVRYDILPDLNQEIVNAYDKMIAKGVEDGKATSSETAGT